MSHTMRGKDRLTKRIRRVCGQIEAIERAPLAALAGETRTSDHTYPQ